LGVWSWGSWGRRQQIREYKKNVVNKEIADFFANVSAERWKMMIDKGVKPIKTKMAVKIKIPKNLQKKTNGDALVVVHGSAIRECFEFLIRQYPDLQGEILDDKGMILPRWMIHINNKSITASDGPTHPVKEGDTIDLLPVIAGG